MVGSDPFITGYILILAGVLGAVFGSFINCMAWRIVRNKSVIKGRSRCSACGHTLSVLDLIPIFSYIFLRGKCRYCKEKLSSRYMLTEILLSLVFVSIMWRYDVSFLALRYLGLSCILLGLSLIDLETYEIPDKFILAGIIWWMVTIPFVESSMSEQLKSGLAGGIALGGGILFLSLLMDKILKKESMGGGDIKLFFMLGLYTGPVFGLLNVILSCFTGLLLIVFLKKNKIPFGPAIAAATWITLIWGEKIISWYLGLFL